MNVTAQSHYPGQHQGKLALNDHHGVALQSFDLSAVKLLDSPFKANQKRESDWILSFPVRRLLHSFRTNAGVYSGHEGGYYDLEPLGGWESLDCELRGHSIGHILSGLALLYASTGEDIYKLKSDSIVTGLAEVQDALGHSGYLSAYPENLIDRNIRGQRVWAPWYTLHKIFSGLLDQYFYCNNEQALKICDRMAAWAYNKLRPLTEEQRKTMLRNEFGGVNDSFYALYSITNNPQHKWLAQFFYHHDVLDPLLAGEDILNKKHANTYIPKLIGVSRGYELGEGDNYRKIAAFFWETVTAHHSFITGSNSDKEKFFEPDHQSKHLTGYTGETCNVYNMLKLTRHLHAQSAQVKYTDFYERALYNHILGQQDPQSGRVAYFLPMLPGAHKVYSTYDQSFWCCVGTGFESHVKYGEFIYSHNERDLYVNLFIPSELNWEERGLKLVQENRFPYENMTHFTVRTTKLQKLSLNVRYPAWATSAQVKINGKISKTTDKPGSYIKLNRDWKDGDRVEVSFGIELKIVPAPDDANVVAFTYGPIVLAGRMGSENMKAPAPFSDPAVRNDYYTYDYKVPAGLHNQVNIDPEKLSDDIERVNKERLDFRLKDAGITLSPIAEIHHERYIIYWNTKNN